MKSRPFGLYKRGRFWWCEFQAGGQRVHRSTKCALLDDAQATAGRWWQQATDQAQGIRGDSEASLEEMFGEWWEATRHTLSASHRNRVEQDWRLHILPALGKRQARTITTADAERLRNTYLDAPSLRNAHQAREDAPAPRPRSMASANKVLLHLHLVFAWAAGDGGLLLRIPWKLHLAEVQEKPKDTLAKEQVPEFLRLVLLAQNRHVHVAVMAQLFLALREEEALSMRWEWFTPDLATFQHGKTKTKDAPRLPVPVVMREALQGLGTKRSGLVLPGPVVDGEVLPHVGQFTRRAIGRAGRALGLRLTPHSLRHSWATMTARETGNAHLVKDGLRHRRLETAVKYVKLSTRDLAAAQVAVFGELAEHAPPKSHHVTRKFLLKFKKQ